MVALPYSSEKEGYDGMVWGVYVRTLDWARRLYFLLQIYADGPVQPTDKHGNDVKGWLAAMPFVEEKYRTSDVGRKIYIRNTGRVSGKELARGLARQLNLIEVYGLDVFAVTTAEGEFTGGAFLVMVNGEQAKRVLDHVLVNTFGYAMELNWALPRKGEKRQREWKEKEQRGYVMPAGGGPSAQEVAVAVDDMIQRRYAHIAMAETMQLTVMAGVEQKRQMFEQIVHDGNKLLFQRLIGYFKAIEVAVDKVGKALAELRGMRFESEEERRAVTTPLVTDHMKDIVGKKRNITGTSAGGGGALPPPITEDATQDQANTFLGHMMESGVGQEMLMQIIEDDRYTPPHMRKK